MELTLYLFRAFIVVWITGLARLLFVSKFRLKAIDIIGDMHYSHYPEFLKLFHQRSLYNQALSLHKWTFKQFYPEWPDLKKGP